MPANAPSHLFPWNEKIKEELILIGQNNISLFHLNKGSRSANVPTHLLPWNEKIKEEILHGWLILIGRNREILSCPIKVSQLCKIISFSLFYGIFCREGPCDEGQRSFKRVGHLFQSISFNASQLLVKKVSNMMISLWTMKQLRGPTPSSFLLSKSRLKVRSCPIQDVFLRNPKVGPTLFI